MWWILDKLPPNIVKQLPVAIDGDDGGEIPPGWFNDGGKVLQMLVKFIMDPSNGLGRWHLEI